jgi:hypothetical protein
LPSFLAELGATPPLAGFKYFYLDRNLNIWRCEPWDKPLGSVFELDRIPDQRQPCHACLTACYCNASMLMHAGTADGRRDSLVRGDIGAAIRTVFRGSVAQSLAIPSAHLGEKPHPQPTIKRCHIHGMRLPAVTT